MKIFKYSLLVLSMLLYCSISAQETDKYRRSSLYSILIDKSDEKFGPEIKASFSKIPIPDKFNDHNILPQFISIKKKKPTEQLVKEYVDGTSIARDVVAKWFNRNPDTGTFNMDLVADRGNYDATFFDVQQASQNVRGLAMLEDAGEDLIGNTFIIVNDIRYVDVHKTAKTVGGILKFAGSLASAYTGNSNYEAVGNIAGSLASLIKGFSVTVETYLFKLTWNNEIANKFYSTYYVDSISIDSSKVNVWKESQGLFKLQYIGSTQVSSLKTSIEGLNLDTPDQMIQKVCTRSLDKSIVELQRSYEVFRVKTPIYKVENDTILVKIGMKEGVSEESVYEIVDRTQNEKGKISYKTIAKLKPVKDKIWDNRFMAIEEKAIGSNLTETKFKLIGGNITEIHEGMLIRESKIN